MDLTWMTYITFLVCLLSFKGTYAQESDAANYINEAVQIFNTIFHKYKLEVPPRNNFPDPLLLGVNVLVSHVQQLDFAGQYMQSTIDLQVYWQDTRLAWYPLNVNEITVNEELIWSPDLSIDNAISDPQLIDSPRLVIDSKGFIYWHKRLNVKTSCQLTTTTNTNNNSNNTCEIVVGSNLLNDEIINFSMNMSSCSFSNVVTSPSLQIDLGTPEIRQEERWLKKAKSFPEYVCKFDVSRIPEAEPLMSSSTPPKSMFVLTLSIACVALLSGKRTF